MKRFNCLIFFLIAITTVLFSSCTKTTITTTLSNGSVTTTTPTGSGSNNTGNSATSSMTFKVDGVEKTMTTSVAEYVVARGSFLLKGQTGAANDDVSFEYIKFKTGTYDVVTDALVFVYGFNNISTSPYTSETGKITITAIDSDFITGTFEFIAADSSNPVKRKTITEGKFHAKYITI